jgi:uncharacterized protein YcfJ
MKSKILLTAGLVLAFVIGTVASSLYSGATRAFNVPQENALTATHTIRSTPVVRTNYVQPRTVAVSDSERVPVQKKRSLKKEALIVGGSAGAGAAIGAAAGGGKGAAIGAVTGGVAGLIYDLATRNK